MRSLHNSAFTGTTQSFPKLFGWFGCVVLVLFLFSCSSIPLLTQRKTPSGRESGLSTRYTMVVIIHGDGDYLYHDPHGLEHKADEEALAGAIKVAMQNPRAEVFVFHQRPRRRTWLFFLHRDGQFYYYRHGQILTQESYRRDGSPRFGPEAEIYHRLRTEEGLEPLKIFLYFGHEIPEFDDSGYDASDRHSTFIVRDLADGLKRFTRDSTKFDLIVLSTCFNGTPHTIAGLAPSARTIVASPENLHLSYLDLNPFERLDIGMEDGDIPAFADKFARQAFNRLTEEIQTAVTVAVYDADRVQKYLHAVDRVYNQSLSILKGQPRGSVEHCDCAEDSLYVLPGMSEGVDVFYSPPRFGRLKHKQIHSGWECWKLLK